MAKQHASLLTQYLIKPALLGFIVAALVLAVLPLVQQPTESSRVATASDLVSFADAVELAAPAVVNIYTTQSSHPNAHLQGPPTLRLGSGVIMNAKGFILTARHVVSNVDQIRVALQDGRVFGAQLIGSDSLTDLAVLRIAADNLAVIPRNDSYTPRVGDVVLAIGNPYNIGQTVTQGIISATGRNNPDNAYSEFIRMDAAINEGNSGGALVNSRGELVGINSGRYLSEQGEELTGISFSVAYHLAERVMEQIIAEGSVTRGYFGVEARHAFHPELNIPGVVIERIEPEGPAHLAGLRPGDFLVRINGVELKSLNQALDMVAATRPGTSIRIDFVRQQQYLTTEAVIQHLRVPEE
ncbi:serine protease [Aliidiomarina taiwanensis]|uniref:Serine protease n=1 Tax=Aliidiomarina taiwanensis TaxID=946228 RepID=A0A432X7P2_9GAMM|nr:trypsin-like peptidase domain-containing protein [Aliidiomarina taiwanensis]RUO42865.1 serine protease [Aliidiomarina taiwanensis]